MLCRRWVDEVWNRGNDEVVDELLADDGVAVYPYLSRDENRLTGRTQYREFIRYVKSQFREVNVEVSDITADDDKVVAVCTFTAVPRAEGEDPLALQSLCLYKIVDGRIAEIWNNVEFADGEVRLMVNDAKV